MILPSVDTADMFVSFEKTNSGFSGDVVVEKVESLEGAFGLNAATGIYEDLIEAGVIDPTKVTRSALENAASIAGLLLTTESLIVDKPISGEKVLVSEGMM